jgi:predicted transcriptional regulator
MKIGYDYLNKNNKIYYYITLNDRGMKDEKISKFFNIPFEDYINILENTKGYKINDIGYVFDTIEDVESAIVTLKMFYDEP